MPPKAKFTKEEIVNTALSIIRRDGVEALTSRALGQALGSSARPIFTVFESMQEVQQETVLAAKALYREYVERGLQDTPAFKGVGAQYILFAMQEPKLFHLLFMSEQPSLPDLNGILPAIEESYEEILNSVQIPYNLDKETACRLYQHLWIYTHGIASLCATKMCRFTGEEIDNMMSEVFVSLLRNIKKEKKYD